MNWEIVVDADCTVHSRCKDCGTDADDHPFERCSDNNDWLELRRRNRGSDLYRSNLAIQDRHTLICNDSPEELQLKNIVTKLDCIIALLARKKMMSGKIHDARNDEWFCNACGETQCGCEDPDE